MSRGSLAVLCAVLLTAACDQASAPPPGGQPAAPSDYAARVDRLVQERAELAAAWRRAGSEEARDEVRRRAASVLSRALAHEILPAWNGTPWSFSGTAVGPGRSPIACGYFVSTTLEHAGLRVERRRLAQQAAEHIVRTLVPEERIARFRRVSLDAFVSAVARQGDGVYVVGLDYHVGFLVVEAGEVFFHHASNNAGEVIREQARVSLPLARSSYRVVGKLFDATLVDKWLAGTAIATLSPS